MDYALTDPREVRVSSTTAALMDEVAGVLAALNQARPLPAEVDTKVRRALLPDRVTASLNMEGITATRRQTLAMMDAMRVQESAGAGEQEVYNALLADEFIADHVEQGGQLSEGFIRETNRQLINGLRPDAGIWRPGDVKLLGAKLVPPPGPAVPALMRQLIDVFPLSEPLHPVVQAAWLHNQFTYVHPFNDGNGRTGRLLQDWALVRRGYWPTGIPNARRDDYYAALEAADHGEWDELVELLGLLQLDIASKVQAVVDESASRTKLVARLAAAAATKKDNTRHKQYIVWRKRVEDVAASFRQIADEVDQASDIIGASFKDFGVVEYREWEGLCKKGTGSRTWVFSLLFFAEGRPFYKTIAYLKRHQPLPDVDTFAPGDAKIALFLTGSDLPENTKPNFWSYEDPHIRLREILPEEGGYFVYEEAEDRTRWTLQDVRTVGETVERFFSDVFERKAGLGG